MKKPKKKKLTLADYRKRKKATKKALALAVAFASIAACVSRATSLFGRMGGKPFEPGGFVVGNAQSPTLSLDEAIINTKEYIDRIPKPSNEVIVNASLIEVLKSKIETTKL